MNILTVALVVNESTAHGGETTAVIHVIPALIILLGICAGIIYLQIFLSKKENKWAGLIMPFISFGVSLMALFGILLFFVSTVTSTYRMFDGEIITQTTQITATSSIILSAIYIFLLYNIPTGILLAIYVACRGKRKKQRDLEKMSIQDL
jgi:glucan phosphoethanolaminetransferase (alkaline phosphatase superfamily)